MNVRYGVSTTATFQPKFVKGKPETVLVEVSFPLLPMFPLLTVTGKDMTLVPNPWLGVGARKRRRSRREERELGLWSSIRPGRKGHPRQKGSKKIGEQ